LRLGTIFMGKPSFAFFGSTNFSKDLLIFLIQKKIKPAAIFSIPENFKISYSKQKVKNFNYYNLKKIADEFKIPYYEVRSTKEKKTKYFKILKELNLDIMLFLGWYYMVPESIRRLSKYGAWGIHASLLPKYAGGAPLVWALINGEKKTGVSLFRMENGVDDGDIILQKLITIDFKDTIEDLYKKVTKISKKILQISLNNYEKLKFTKQDKKKIEIYPQRTPKDGRINWFFEAIDVYNFIRAQTKPYPCAFSKIKNTNLKIKVIS
jgi:methionyl-tRNA formyltransferase